MTQVRVRRYKVRIASGTSDLRAAQALRMASFGLSAPDHDRFDEICTHMLIEDHRLERLAGCFRLLPLASGAEIARSYAAQFYDLAALQAYPRPMTELGRFCTHPAARDPDVLRAAWGAIAAHVDTAGVGLLFGCASFRGTDPALYRDAFDLLARNHLAPRQWAPRAARTAQNVPLKRLEVPSRLALASIPPLLRSYLGMGGWVSDHAVIDPEMQTLHVFTGLEIDSIPPGRQRLLRAILDDSGVAG